MTLTCPRCAQGIVVRVTSGTREVNVTCPTCGTVLTVQIDKGRNVGPTEFKRGHAYTG